MKIAFNPESEHALQSAPKNNDITFDLKGIAIYAKGTKFKGTDTTYSVFKKHPSSDNTGGYDGLVPSPSYNNNSKNRFLREDGTWSIPSISGKVSNDLILKINSGTTEDTSLYTYNGSAAKTLDIKAGSNITLTAASNALTIAASDTKVTQTNTTSSDSYRVLFSGNANNTTETTTARKSSKLLFNPSTGNLTTTSLNLNGDIVINDGNNNNRYIKWQYDNTDDYGWRIGYLGSKTADDNDLTFDSHRKTEGWASALYFKHTTLNAHFAGIVNAPTFQGNLDWSYLTNVPTSFTPAAHDHKRIISSDDSFVGIEGTASPSTYANGLTFNTLYVGKEKGWPISYGNILTMRGRGDSQIVVSWSSSQTETVSDVKNEIYFRSKRDALAGDNWTDWTRVLTDRNYSEYCAPKVHTHTSDQITALTGYTKATSASDLAATDSLNTALGKLEYKADTAYDWIISVTTEDTDKYVNKWQEILDFLNKVDNTEGADITDEFVTRKTDQTITGFKTFIISNNTKVILGELEKSNIKISTDAVGGWARGLTLQGVQGDNVVTASFGVKGDTKTSKGNNIINYLYLAHQGQNYETATFKVHDDKATILDNEIYHKGNLKNLSDLNDDIVSGKYLLLSGGTMTGHIKLTLGTSSIRNNTDMVLLAHSNNSSYTGVTTGVDTVVLGNSSYNTLIRSNNTDLIHYKSSASYSILDASNYSSYLPFLNSTTTRATKDSVIYAPNTAGTSGYILSSNVSGMPVWDYGSGRVKVFGTSTQPASSNEATIKFEGNKYNRGFYIEENYQDANTPCSFGNIITALGTGGGQLLLGWEGSYKTGNLYYRSHRDNTLTGGWTPWKQIAFTDSDITGNAATASLLKSNNTGSVPTGLQFYSGWLPYGNTNNRSWCGPTGNYTSNSVKGEWGSIIRVNYDNTHYNELFFDANDTRPSWRRITGTTSTGWKTLGFQEDIRPSGYVTSSTAGLSSYWGKLWEHTRTNLNNDLGITFYIHSAYFGIRGFIHIKVRRNASTTNNVTTYSHQAHMWQISGNIPSNIIRLYHDATSGKMELWVNVEVQYGVYNATIISCTDRVGKEVIPAYGTLYTNTFTTVQTLPSYSYISLSNIASDQIRVQQHTTNNTEYPLVWSNQTNANSIIADQLYKSYNNLTYNPSLQRITVKSINSNLVTNTHLAGNQGTAIINSTAAAGAYTMLAKMNSTDGYFTQGVYGTNYNLYYTNKSVVDAGTNATSYYVTLLGEDGNSKFPRHIYTNGKKSYDDGKSGIVLSSETVHICGSTPNILFFSNQSTKATAAMYNINNVIHFNSPQDGSKASVMQINVPGVSKNIDWGLSITSVNNAGVNNTDSGVGIVLGSYARGNTSHTISRGAGIAAVAEDGWYNFTGIAFYVNNEPSATKDSFSEKMRLSHEGHLIPKFSTTQTLGTSDLRWSNTYSVLGNFSGQITSAGFVRTGSSDSYVLLGGGGHKAISDFMLKSDELTNNLVTITKNLTVTQEWMDTGIYGPANDANGVQQLFTGTYIIEVCADTGDIGNSRLWSVRWSGVMSWYGGITNSTNTDEILLHCAGHAYGTTIYLRTINSNRTDTIPYTRLQIAASTNYTAEHTFTFKFKRVI